ncbi:GNAT family N-acetyltransferase [Aliterella atlantica]|uniref:GCN5 family acetyltransferase n=1 Tax=Aliterella atlantica CENA595 TaxID=1618023 RepID=A0A0D8ZWG1_9CYAN|nr:GNAT family N-acetyltransferase [Aliterella atlantica]KJH72712.1 GCN5 family acetyltransferase [Aliterella atlantica CENA595]
MPKNSTIVAETPRLILRHLTINDADDLAAIYADPVVMKFYPSLWTYTETKQQIERTIVTYEKIGFGLWATIYKANNKFIGRCGLVPQLVDGQQEIEIGYLLAKEYWNKGLATEAACASRDYGFEQVGCDRLISLIDPGNIASQKVALKTSLTYEKNTTMWEKLIRVYTIHNYR